MIMLAAALDVAMVTNLQKVAAIGRAIVIRYHKHNDLGHVAYEKEREIFLGQIAPRFGSKPYSEATARDVARSVRDIVAGRYRRALELLRRRVPLQHASAVKPLKRATFAEPNIEPIRVAAAATVVSLPNVA